MKARLLITVIVLFLHSNGKAQLSIIGSVSKRSEAGIVDNESAEKKYRHARHKIYVHDIFGLGAVFDKNRMSYSGEVTLNSKARHFRYSQQYIGGSHGNETTTERYSAEVDYAYIGLNLSTCYSPVIKERFSLQIGGFLNIEKLLYENESEHTTDVDVLSYYEVGDPNTGEVNYVWNHNVYPTDYSEYNAFDIKKVFVSAGTSLQARIKLNFLQLIPYYSFGYCISQKNVEENLSNNNHKPEISRWSHEAGLKIAVRVSASSK